MSTNRKPLALLALLLATPAGAQQLLAPPGHAAGMLPDGTVLVMGGDGGSNGIPTTGAWSFAPGSSVPAAAGSLMLPRTHHAAVSLFDGRILVVGGNDGYGGMESLELFDPLTFTFTLSKATLANPRQDCLVYGLADGRVLIRGGYDRAVQVAVDEIYDPRTDTVTLASGSPPIAVVTTDRQEYLPGDTVYVSGSGFAPGENVDLLFDENPLVHAPEVFTSIADASGNISGYATYHVDQTDLGTAFTLNAVGTSSGLTASTSFHDAANLVLQNVAWSASSVNAPGTFTVTFTAKANGPSDFSSFDGVSAQVLLSTGANLPSGYSQAPSASNVTILQGGRQTFSITVSIPATAPTASLSLIVRVTAAGASPSSTYLCGDKANCTSDSSPAWPMAVVGTVRPVTPTLAASDKVYDGTTAANATCTLSGVSPGDAVGCNVTSASFSDASVGSGKTVTGSVSLSGASASHYQLTSATATGTASITARPITVTADAQSKTYGDADPKLTYQVTSGTLVSGDTFSGSLTRDPGESVGTYAIRQGSLALSTNYALTYVGANLTISARTLTVTADAQSKVCGAADPTLTYRITSGALVGTDALSGALIRDAGENVGTYAIRQGTLTAGGNYQLSFNGASLTVTARPITVTADPKTKVYGDADPALTYQITSGSLVGSDAFTGALTRAGTEGVGSYAIQQGTLALSANYAVTYVGANLTVTARPITVTADAKTKVYGDTDPALTYQITSGKLVTGDAFTGALSRAAGENVGTYAITQGTLALSANYVLTFAGAKLTILSRPITVTADAQSKTYGNSDPKLSYQVTSGSVVAGDAFTGALIRAAGEDVGTYAITQGTLALSVNYALTFVPSNLTIIARPITVTADAKSKIYGDGDPALTFQITTGSLASSDAFTGAPSRAAGENAGTYAINQGTLALGANYVLTFVPASLTVTARPITVTADPKTKVLAAPDPAFTYKVTSGSLAFSDSLTGALTRVTGEAIGLYPIQQGTLAPAPLSANYTVTFVGANLTIQYAQTGACLGDAGHSILQPIAADGSTVRKGGSTVPAKFRVCDANGNSIGTPGVVSAFRNTYTIVGTTNTTVDATVYSTTPDAQFRWDPTAQQWIFNVDSSALKKNVTYGYAITLNDGSSIGFQFGLR